MTMKENQYGRDLKIFKKDLNELVEEMLDTTENSDNSDLTKYDIKISFKDKEQTFYLNSNLYQMLEELIDEQIEEWGSDYESE